MHTTERPAGDAEQWTQFCGGSNSRNQALTLKNSSRHFAWPSVHGSKSPNQLRTLRGPLQQSCLRVRYFLLSEVSNLEQTMLFGRRIVYAIWFCILPPRTAR